METSHLKIIKEINHYFPDQKDDYSHSIEHTFRVYDLCKAISHEEGVSQLESCIAAIFHDVARKKEDLGLCKDHALEGAKICDQVLNKLNYDSSLIQKIKKCIIMHRTSSFPETIEQKILRDADKLDSLGAVGISRLISSSVQVTKYSRPLFKKNSKLIGHPTKSGIHYLRLRLDNFSLKNNFYTKTGYRMSLKRIEIMENFLESFLIESFYDKKLEL